jgi:hypothetical protein
MTHNALINQPCVMTRDPVETMLRLERLASLLEQGRLLAPQDAALVADAIRAVWTGRASTLDEALGLVAARGQPTLQKRLARHVRDLHLRAAAELLAPGANATAQAQSLHEADERYRSGRWARDRTCQDCPPDLVGRIEEYLWRARHAFPYIPQERALQSILAKRPR